MGQRASVCKRSKREHTEAERNARNRKLIQLGALLEIAGIYHWDRGTARRFHGNGQRQRRRPAPSGSAKATAFSPTAKRKPAPHELPRLRRHTGNRQRRVLRAHQASSRCTRSTSRTRSKVPQGTFSSATLSRRPFLHSRWLKGLRSAHEGPRRPQLTDRALRIKKVRRRASRCLLVRGPSPVAERRATRHASLWVRRCQNASPPIVTSLFVVSVPIVENLRSSSQHQLRGGVVTSSYRVTSGARLLGNSYEYTIKTR
jgi:hypothetical protein